MALLGILVTDPRHGDHVFGLCRVALKAGHRVGLFFTDHGVTLLSDPRLESLRAEGLAAQACAKSCAALKIALPAGMEPAGQMQNAALLSRSTRYLVF